MAAISRKFSINTAYDAISNTVAKYFSSKVAYLATTEQSLDKATLSQAKIIILSRACYRESSTIYPLASISELKKILKHQDNGECNFHFIGDLKDGARKVITISVFPMYAAHCKHAVMVVPASLLVSYAAPAAFSHVRAADNQFYVQKSADGLWQSALQSLFIDTADRAKLALGVAADTAVGEYELPKSEHLTTTLFKIPVRFWTSCLSQKQFSKTPLNIKPLLFLTLTFGVIYLAVSSFYLTHILSARQQEFSKLVAETELISAGRRQLEQQQALIGFLVKQQHDPLQSLAFWSVYASWQLQDIRLVSVRSDFNEMRLQGDAPSATTVLQKTLELPYVMDASFTAPVRRDAQGREVFSLVLTLNHAFNEKMTTGTVSHDDISAAENVMETP